MKPADPGRATIAAFNGLAQIVVRSKPGQPGGGQVAIAAEGLPKALVALVAKP
jgi:hypothetical protein